MRPDWTDLTLAYTAYLAAMAWTGRRYARARMVATLALATALGLWWRWPVLPDAPDATVLIAWVVVPGLALLAAYRLSGTFFTSPMPGLERALVEADRRWLWQTGLLPAYAAAPLALREVFELSYLLVYVMVPAGAVTIVLAGRGDALPGFWAVIFLAELACYAWLPWLRTRPPRVLESAPVSSAEGPIRRLNHLVLRHGSIQVNTVPSAHAAGAVAIALAVRDAVPAAGAPFVGLAVAIALATVLGRYHYAVDTALGVAVGVIAWTVTGAWR